MEIDPNYFSKIPVEIFEELDRMSKEKETLIKPENDDKTSQSPSIPSDKDIKDKNIIKPEDKNSKSSVENVEITKDSVADDKKTSEDISKVFKISSDKNIEEIKKALGEDTKKEEKSSTEEKNIEDDISKKDKKATEEINKKYKKESKKDIKKEIKKSSKEKEEKNKKDEKISTVLSAVEKKRYENLGKAFMVGADAAFSEIQNAIDKKEKNSLSNKDSVEGKIKNAEEKLKKDKSKKSSVLKNIAIAAAALGGLVLIFGTINGSFSTIFTKIKNGIMDFKDYIKNSASSIMSFFGNMFVKAAQSMSGGGFLTTIMGGIIWDFFNLTLPTMVIGLVEDLVRIIDKSFNSSVKLNENQSKLENGYKNASKEVESNADVLKREMDKFLLMQETDIRNNNILSNKIQEEIADESIGQIKEGMDAIRSALGSNNSKQATIIREWSNSVVSMLLSNQYTSTKFYSNAGTVLNAIDTYIPKIMDANIKSVKDSTQKDFINNFAKNFGSLIGMSVEEINAYGALDLKYKLEIIKNISSGATNFKNSVDESLEKAEQSERKKSDKNDVVELMKSIREDIKDKNTDLKIIKFQETAAIGKLNNTIRDFLYNSKFLEVLQNMSTGLGDKFGMIMDAANVALANLPKSIATNFVSLSGDEEITLTKVDDNSGAGVQTLDIPNDYKLMYIFNNNVPYMDSAIDNDMNIFLNFSVAYAQLMSQEIGVLAQMERITTIMTNGIFYNSQLVRENYDAVVRRFNQHTESPVQEDGLSAHRLIIKHPSIASNDTPLMATNSGMMII